MENRSTSPSRAPSIPWRRIAPGLLLVAWIGLPYMALQRIDWRPVTVLEWDPVTRSLPFIEASVWVYLSMYPFLAWAGLGCRPRDFWAYLWTCALTATVAHLVFLLWPTEVPRPEIPEAGALYEWLRQTDRPRNALPSLHAALSVLGGIVLWRRHHGWVGWLAVAWAAAIILSTMTLRQHVVADLTAGMVLAAVCWWALGRRIAVGWKSECPDR